jgi:hypothetical protein
MDSSYASCSSSSSGSSFWDSGPDSESDSEHDAPNEYSEWRDCLRGMEAKYPRGAGETHTPAGKCDVVESQRRQGVSHPGEVLISEPELEPPQPVAPMHSYSDDPPTYEVAVGEPQRATVPSAPNESASRLAQTKDGAHLALFQTLAEDVQKVSASCLNSRLLTDRTRLLESIQGYSSSVAMAHGS